jgi:hypothetical protein
MTPSAREAPSIRRECQEETTILFALRTFVGTFIAGCRQVECIHLATRSDSGLWGL